jgi:hypothetical protein
MVLRVRVLRIRVGMEQVRVFRVRSGSQGEGIEDKGRDGAGKGI